MVFSRHRPGNHQRAARMLRFLPMVLIGMRFLLGPLLFVDAWDGITSVWFLVGLTTAFLSDVFDGVIALTIRHFVDRHGIVVGPMLSNEIKAAAD